jgi:hypothetical protein
MTSPGPVTTAAIPTPLKQGVYRAMPAKEHPVHKQAEADAAAATKAARSK